MPALPRNTYRTPHGFQFRKVVPAALRHIIGKREIKESLGKSYREAVSQANIWAVRVDKELGEARKQLKAPSLPVADHSIDAFLAPPRDKRLKPVTAVTAELIDGLKSLWLSTLDADVVWRNQGLDDEDMDELDENIKELKALLARSIARGHAAPFIPFVNQLLLMRGYELMVESEAERQLVLAVLPAVQQGYEVLEQRQAGRMVVPDIKAPALSAPWNPPTVDKAAQGMSWDELYEYWANDKVRSGRTALSFKQALDSLTAFLPDSRPHSLTKPEITSWFGHLRKAHGNRPATIEKKGNSVGAMFSIAVKDELLEKNPFAGYDYARLKAKTGAEDEEERDPFSNEQLKQIFSEETLFGVTKRIGGGGYHARTWMPSLSLLSGARLDELGSLTTADVLMEPVPHICIRKGKTASSVREFPLHPKLIELGFLEYVGAIRQAGHMRLWPHLISKSEKVKDSEVQGKWFNRYIRDTLSMPPSVVFHSLRHTFKDLCRNALIPREVHHALTGHSDGGDDKNVGDGYGKGYSLEVKLQELSKVKLGFDLPRPAPWKSDQAIDTRGNHHPGSVRRGRGRPRKVAPKP